MAVRAAYPPAPLATQAPGAAFPSLAPFEQEARLAQSLCRRRELQYRDLEVEVEEEQLQADDVEAALSFASGRHEFAEDQLERFRLKAREAASALVAERQELYTRLGPAAEAAGRLPESPLASELADVEREVAELAVKWRQSQEKEERHDAEHRRLMATAMDALHEHQTFRCELAERRDAVAKTLAKLHALRALCILSDEQIGFAETLRQCDEHLTNIGVSDDSFDLVQDFESLSPLGLILPLMRSDVGPGGVQATEKWLLPAQDEAADLSDPGEAARLEGLVKDLVDRNEALRQELYAPDAASEQTMYSEVELRLSGLEENSSELQVEVARVEGELSGQEQDIADIRAQLSRVRSEVECREQELTEQREASRRFEHAAQHPSGASTLDSTAKSGEAGLRQVRALRDGLAEAYRQLALGPGSKASEDDVLERLRSRAREARAERASLKVELEGPAVEAAPRGATGYQAAEVRMELVSRLARNRTEIADLKERLRREELPAPGGLPHFQVGSGRYAAGGP